MRKEFFVVFATILVFTFSVFLNVTAGFGFLERPALFLEEGLANISYQARSFFSFLIDFPKITQENQELKQQLASFGTLRIANKELEAQNVALKKQLGEKDTSKKEYLSAQVLGTVLEGGSSYYLLNKGKKDGFLERQVVVSGNIFLGIVEKMTDYQSWVLPLTASKSSVAVNIYNDSGTIKGKGLVVGEYNLNLFLDKVLPDIDLTVGDLVVSSGLDSKAPAGLLVGRISRVQKKDNQIFQQAQIEAALNFYSLQTVFVIEKTN